MQRTLAGFSSMLGFGMAGVPSGFCGGIALLASWRQRPSVTNQGYTLSPQGAAKLYAHCRATTYTDPDQGVRLLCDANGAMNIFGMYACLSGLASGTHVLTDYASFELGAFHTALQTYAGVRALLIEWDNGRAFPGNETDLDWHFSTCGAIDTERPCERAIGAYGFADDDSQANVRPARANAPIWHVWESYDANGVGIPGPIQNAGPRAYILAA